MQTPSSYKYLMGKVPSDCSKANGFSCSVIDEVVLKDGSKKIKSTGTHKPQMKVAKREDTCW